MQKVDIAMRIHQEAGISNDEATRLLDWILEFLKTTLQAGEPITLVSLPSDTRMLARDVILNG